MTSLPKPTGPLILVRHGRTVRDPSLLPSEWPLQDADSCRALARLLPEGSMVVSDEPKALGTARALGRGFRVDARLREVGRPFTADSGAFEEEVAAYLRGEHVEGWEPQSKALGRFSEAATGIVVSHGTIMSLYVGAVTGADPFNLWKGLEMPDAWEVTSDGALVHLARRP